MGRKQVEAITRAHGAQLEKGAGDHAAPDKKDETKGTLVDPEVQQKILRPDEKKIKLSDDSEITLHKPSIMMGRRIYGFATRVLADAASVPGTTSQLIPVRVASLLCSRSDLERQLLEMAAMLFDRPGRISDERASVLADELQQSVNPSDIAVLFAELCQIAGIGVQDPKNSKPRRRT